MTESYEQEPADTGTSSAEADLEAGFASDDELAEDGLAGEPDRPADSHQADVDAGFDDDKELPPSV